jgi:hypothetical protein
MSDLQKIWISGSNSEVRVVFDGCLPLKRKIDGGTVIQAQYRGLITALELLRVDKPSRSVIYLDNRYIVDQFSKNKTPARVSHVRLFDKARSLLREIPGCRLMYLPKSELKKYTG